MSEFQPSEQAHDDLPNRDGSSYGKVAEEALRPSVDADHDAEPDASSSDHDGSAPEVEARGKPTEDVPEKSDRGTEAEKDEPPPPPPSKWVFIVAGLILVGLLAWGAYGHWQRNSQAQQTQQQTRDMVPEVRVGQAKKLDQPIDLTLPGQTEALYSSNIYPRATGYIAKRFVDIGSRVRKGDLLLQVSAPDLDQQLAQAVAQLGQVEAAERQAQAQVDQAEANLNLAKVTLARTNQLTQQGYETLQNRDNQQASLQSQQANLETAQAGVRVAVANTKAQQATVDRLKALTSFEQVTAPFSGVITMRNVDVGDLVNADTASASALFGVDDDDVIRVTVQVPQNAAIGVKDGNDAEIHVPQMPGQVFKGKVTRTSVALISSARTLTTEVDIPNPDHKLRPGLYVYVTVKIPRDHPSVEVPSEALIFNQEGLQVATLEDEKAKLHDVKVFRDYGTTVELSQGLEGGEQIVLGPPALLKDGSRLKPRKPDEKEEGGDATKKPQGPNNQGSDKQNQAEQNKKETSG